MNEHITRSENVQENKAWLGSYITLPFTLEVPFYFSSRIATFFLYAWVQYAGKMIVSIAKNNGSITHRLSCESTPTSCEHREYCRIGKWLTFFINFKVCVATYATLSGVSFCHLLHSLQSHSFKNMN